MCKTNNNNNIHYINNCSICLKKLENTNNNTTFTTICNHEFHYICIQRWIKINNSCPSCRRENICSNPEKYISNNNYYSRNKYFNSNLKFI